MKSIWMVFSISILSLGLVFSTAEAKRMGGGGSFGGKSQYSQPQKRSATQDNNSSPAAAPNSAAGQTAAQGGSRMPRGGMLGGLLAGGLLGALFFGGAFDQIKFADIVILGLMAFILFKLFRYFAARRSSMPAAAANVRDVYNRESVPPFAGETAGSTQKPSTWSPFASKPVESAALQIPAGIEPDQVLAETRDFYMRLQKAWDEGDMASVRELSTDKVFGEIQDQYRARGGENRTEISELKQELVGARELATEWEVSVLFDAQMIEHDAQSPLMPPVQQVREVWHFTKSKSALRKQWVLDGIQQVEYT